jgi:ATP adenylyltransferase
MDRIYAPWRSKYFTMPREEGCLFCNIQKETRDESVGILKRGRHWFVILNTFPYTSGHIMIVAVRHIERLADITREEGAELMDLLVLCERALDEAYRPEGLNVGINRGISAGAGVLGHLHVHLCPRWAGDTNFFTAIAETRVVSEELENSYKKLLPLLSDTGKKDTRRE